MRKYYFFDPKDYKKDLSKYEIRKGDLLIAMSLELRLEKY